MKSMKKQAKAILKSLLKDISSNDALLLRDAELTLHSIEISTLLIQAGCPSKVIDAMKETIPLSHIERVYCCGQILTRIER